jgi:hypothetical protein
VFVVPPEITYEKDWALPALELVSLVIIDIGGYSLYSSL